MMCFITDVILMILHPCLAICVVAFGCIHMHAQNMQDMQNNYLQQLLNQYVMCRIASVSYIIINFTIVMEVPHN